MQSESIRRSLRRSLFAAVLPLAIVIGPRNVAGAERATEGAVESRQQGKWDLILYRGLFTDTVFAEIMTAARTDYRPSTLTTLAFNYKTDARLRQLRFESEGQLVQHEGLMDHREFNGVLVARWDRFLPFLPMSLAFGEGLSYALEKPGLEQREIDLLELQLWPERTSRLLNYFYVELDWELPFLGERRPRLLFRIHHRSGVYGTYCDYGCGSNFITYGFKIGI